MNKKNLILGGILLSLIALAFLYEGPIKNWQAAKNRPSNFLAGLKTDQIDKIDINSSQWVLKKTDGDWRVENKGNFPASASYTNNAIEQLKSASSDNLELISSNKARKADFKTDDGGIKVKLYNGDRILADIVVGKLSSDFQGSFVSSSDSDNTYKFTKTNLFTAFSVNDWRDLAILNLDPAKIAKIRVQFPNQQFVIEKKNNDWFDNKTKLNSDKVGQLLSNLSNLNAVEIPAQDFKPAGLDKSQLIIQLMGEGFDKTIMIGKENGKGKLYIKRADNDNIYLINKSTFEAINEKPEQLK